MLTEVKAGEITVAESVEAHDQNDMDLVELWHEASRYRSRHKQAVAEADRLLRIAERHERTFRRMLRVNAQRMER